MSVEPAERLRDRLFPRAQARRRSLLNGFRLMPATAVAPRLYDAPIAEAELRAALRRHHEWMLGQTEADEHGIVPAEAYQESEMCEETMRLLGKPETAWAPISPGLSSRVKAMQYAVAYNVDLDCLRMKLSYLLADVRQAIASVRPLGAGMPLRKVRALRDGVAAIADHLTGCGEALDGADGKDFLARAAVLGHVVDLFDETLKPVEAVET
jgi:hypothetical protein